MIVWFISDTVFTGSLTHFAHKKPVQIVGRIVCLISDSWQKVLFFRFNAKINLEYSFFKPLELWPLQLDHA